ncbi:hypothetical protein GWI33_001254 [Rhynchophorus ferrugineus]|uniref:MSP domain-containing protein n=1 Tax=Rhynchophorus ferrugineus TaxID=354439 RepID=A0A834INJ2_RHYFE|nr:hypothetical protein GWI33_001254 [Rhynchophorus ferrugineus]
MSMNYRQVPVFVFPSSLRFFLGSKSSHTQVVTLYSPYDFPIKYKVHCHAACWDKYIVPNPEGTIPPQNSVDLVITLKHITPSNCNISDKFKIVIQDSVTDKLIGRKTIESTIFAGEKDNRYHNDDDFEFQSSVDSSSRSVQGENIIRNIHVDRTRSNNVMSTLIILVCAIILFLPVEPENNKASSLPIYFHVSHKIQLLAALLLGIFLCILVRS